MALDVSPMTAEIAGCRRRSPRGAVGLRDRVGGSSRPRRLHADRETHGHSLDESQIAKITPGSTSRQQVLQLMGSPSALSAFDDAAWYYVSQRTEENLLLSGECRRSGGDHRQPFGDNDRVAAVDRHGLDQTASIDPVDRVTPTAGSSPSVFKQLIGNIGRFSGSSRHRPRQLVARPPRRLRPSLPGPAVCPPGFRAPGGSG